MTNVGAPENATFIHTLRSHLEDLGRPPLPRPSGSGSDLLVLKDFRILSPQALSSRTSSTSLADTLLFALDLAALDPSAGSTPRGLDGLLLEPGLIAAANCQLSLWSDPVRSWLWDVCGIVRGGARGRIGDGSGVCCILLVLDLERRPLVDSVGPPTSLPGGGVTGPIRGEDAAVDGAEEWGPRPNPGPS